MSVNGLQQPYVNNSLDGLVYVEVDGLTINGIPVDPTTFIPYTGATKPVNLGPFSLETLTSLSARQVNFTTFTSSMMTGPTTSSLFTADAWQMNNTIQISSLSGGAFLSTSYLHIRDTTNSSTLLTLQSDGVADFGSSIPRASTLATSNYDLVNLSTLSNAVAYLEGITSLNFVPYVGSLNNLDMGGSTITTAGLMSAGAVRITSSVINADYTLSVNSSDQLEFTNLSNGSIFKTNGADLFVTGTVNCATLGATNVEAGTNIYLAKGSTAEWRTTLGMSDEYEILDNAGVMRSRLSKTTGLTVSTLNITQVPSLTPSLALGINGGGQVVSFAVPTATNILPLANVFTNTNTFNSTLTTAVGETTSINGALSTSLVDLGFTSASFTTAGITGAYTPPLGTITNPSGSTYQITQTAQGRSIMAISGFTPSVGITYVFSFNINCTIGTATISVEQDNIVVSPALYQLTTGFNVVKGSFTYNGTPNTVVFKIYTGVASWNAQWDSFTLSTYSIGMNANMNALTVNNRFTQRYNALPGDVSTLVNRSTLDSAISATSIVNLANTFTNTNLFNSTLSTSQFSDVSLGGITTITAVPFTTGQLQTAGISSQAISPGTITFGVPATLTPSPTTAPFASCYSISQLFPTTNARYECRFTGFTSSIFGVSLTIYRANVANTARIAISATVPVVVGTFTLGFLPNSNPSFVGQVFLEFSGTANKTMGWTSFTYRQGIETIAGNFTVSGDTTTGNITVGTTKSITKVGGNSGANFFRLQGDDAGSSPYTEYHFNNLRRMYVGNVTASDAIIASENSAQLVFATQGLNRMTIDTAGDVIATNNLKGGTLVINGGGGTYQEGCIFTDANWGMLLRAKVPGTNSAFGFYNSVGAELMTIKNNGETNIPLRLTVGGPNSSGIINVRNPNGSFTHLGWIDNLNYFRGAGNIFDGYIQLNSVAFGLPRIQSPNNLRSMLYDDANGLTYLQNISGATPIPFTHSSWGAGSGGGYTLISRAQGINVMALGFGVSNYRAVIMALAPAISWGELILSGGTIYTACFGTINNYTNGGGWVFVSDKRVKKNIKDIKTARSLERIMALKPKTYKKIYPENSETPVPQEVRDADHIGLLAQDVQEINPHCISEWVDDKCICDGDDGKRLGINYGDINIHMVGAIQELKKQNDAQQRKLDELERIVSDQNKLLEFLLAKLK
jgi:hypothetical protein